MVPVLYILSSQREYVSCLQVKDDQVVITLHKEVARSWVPELSTGGLETQEEEEDPSND